MGRATVPGATARPEGGVAQLQGLHKLTKDLRQPVLDYRFAFASRTAAQCKLMSTMQAREKSQAGTASARQIAEARLASDAQL